MFVRMHMCMAMCTCTEDTCHAGLSAMLARMTVFAGVTLCGAEAAVTLVGQREEGFGPVGLVTSRGYPLSQSFSG